MHCALHYPTGTRIWDDCRNIHNRKGRRRSGPFDHFGLAQYDQDEEDSIAEEQSHGMVLGAAESEDKDCWKLGVLRRVSTGE